MIGPKIFLTDNYGVYFYLIGSLIFYFQMIKTTKTTLIKEIIQLIIFVLIALFIVYYLQPKYK
jgi:hypothetical protein